MQIHTLSTKHAWNTSNGFETFQRFFYETKTIFCFD